MTLFLNIVQDTCLIEELVSMTPSLNSVQEIFCDFVIGKLISMTPSFHSFAGDMSNRKAYQYDTTSHLQCAADRSERKAGQYDTIPPQCALRWLSKVTK